MNGTLALPRGGIWWRTFRSAARLGWQIESNWTDPFLFLIYSIARPLSQAAILVAMYAVVSRADFHSPAFSYLYLGNAFYIFVGAVLTGVSWGVIDDRERYRMLKYVYAAPVSVPLYFIGRGAARFLMAAMSVLVTLAAGILVLGVPVEWGAVDWALLALSLTLGIVMLALLGLIMAGVMLVIAHQVEVIGEAVAAGLYLFSGAVFPLEILPGFLRPIGYVLPISWWLDLMRRALSPTAAAHHATFARFSDGEMLAVLAGMTAVVGLAAAFVFKRLDRKAREAGLIDRVTNY
jgi:ABC-2 type transport system permease protein